MATPYTALSQRLTSELDAIVKKTQGIYFSPPSIIAQMLDQVFAIKPRFDQVLEPTCGSCEVLQALDKRLPPGARLTGVELNPHIYENIKGLPFTHPTDLIQADYLVYRPPVKPDLICGNPPYFVIPPAKKGTIPKAYRAYYEGRPNIFVLMFLKALDDIAPGGVISFILPRNFLNCLYYNKFRRHLLAGYTVHSIVDCGATADFLETEQDTIIFTVINKKPGGSPSTWNWNPYGEVTVFGTAAAIQRLTTLAAAGSTLSRMNFNVHVGTVVWNQVKEELTDDPVATRLVYSGDIGSNGSNGFTPKTYTPSNPAKKGYIKRPGLTELLLVINRGYGKGAYSFNYALLDTGGKPFLVENHLICVRSNDATLSPAELRLRFNRILASFADPRTAEFIALYFGNNIMNTTELNNILPIF
jgi:tRNA1(Val) A37 N6-methylase TrmN6